MHFIFTQDKRRSSSRVKITKCFHVKNTCHKDKNYKSDCYVHIETVLSLEIF